MKIIISLAASFKQGDWVLQHPGTDMYWNGGKTGTRLVKDLAHAVKFGSEKEAVAARKLNLTVDLGPHPRSDYDIAVEDLVPVDTIEQRIKKMGNTAQGRKAIPDLDATWR